MRTITSAHAKRLARKEGPQRIGIKTVPGGFVCHFKGHPLKFFRSYARAFDYAQRHVAIPRYKQTSVRRLTKIETRKAS